jgi:hypothetical protein
VIWTSRLLVVHRRQKAAYTLDGHDIEDLLETARCRDAALEVKIDSMDSIAELHDEPEPWELVADEAAEIPDEDPIPMVDVIL